MSDDPVAFYRWAQRRLNAANARLDDDGNWGRESTAALIAYQRKNGLPPTGLLDQSTVIALRKGPAGVDTGPAGAPVRAPWLAEMQRQAGLHEVRDNKRLWDWLRRGGSKLGDPAKHPWCGAAMMAAIAMTLPDEPLPTNPYWARDWLKFGRECGPVEGAISVFSRPGGGGHVTSLLRETRTHFVVYGGNQSNGFFEASIKKDRLLGHRWPKTYRLNLKAVDRVANAAAAPVSTNEA